MTTLPQGTVTFLFTDVEGSTRLLHELGDAYAEVLAEHRRALREAFAQHGGVEVDTQGDAFFFAFAKASDALAAADSGRAALADGPIRVRMGVHTGEPVVTPEGYVGIDVHRAARIAAAGHGGQILVSQSTRDLAAGVDGLRDLGDHRLKDLTAPERIFQLGDDDFPPLKSLNATNLPIAASDLVGRKRELEELQELLRNGVRAVTLTGPGGSGKTRLGLQVAAELVDEFPGGVFFVPLAGVGEADLVEGTIAGTIGLRELAELGERRALLLLDNFEHVLDAAPAVATMLASTPNVKVLATSRAPLRISGEREYPVEPLPDDDAVGLLTERARAVRPDFEPDESTRAICRRLDGLPLALELAASRLRALDSQALLERLEQRLPLLTGGRRDAPERQQTLRATIEWSYDLLNPELQAVFARLGIFAGTFSLAAAEAVVQAGFDDLDALVEASLLKPAGGGRLLMLQTIREFARERVDGLEDVARRHAEFLVELAVRANLHAESSEPMRHDLVLPEADNIRAALRWAVDTGHAELGLQLAGALENYWVTSDPEEGRRWFEALLPNAPAPPSELHALALRCLGNCTTITGDVDRGQGQYEESAAEYRQLGDELRAAIVDHRVANAELMRGNDERAVEVANAALETFRTYGSARGEAQVLLLLGDVARRAGTPDRALALYERSLELARETGFSWWEKHSLYDQGLVLLELDRAADSADRIVSGIAVARSIDDRLGVLHGTLLLARARSVQGHNEVAGMLYGAVLNDVARLPIAGWSYLAEAADAWFEASSGDEYEQGLAHGRQLSVDEAIEAARP